MPSIFNARDADSYEQTMGRWSRRLAPLFIEHAGAAAGERLLEVGCRTGSLTFALAGTVAFGELTAIDYADVHVAPARAKNRDPRIHIEKGDAVALCFPDAHFDRAVAPGPAIRPRAGGGGGADAAGHPAGGSGRRGGMGFRRWASRSADILGYRRDAGRRRGRAARRRHVEAGGRSRRARAAVQRSGPRRRAALADPHGARRLRRLLGAVPQRRGANGRLCRRAGCGGPGAARTPSAGGVPGRCTGRATLLRGDCLVQPGGRAERR
jgi:methyltransferase family protein